MFSLAPADTSACDEESEADPEEASCGGVGGSEAAERGL